MGPAPAYAQAVTASLGEASPRLLFESRLLLWFELQPSPRFPYQAPQSETPDHPLLLSLRGYGGNRAEVEQLWT